MTQHLRTIEQILDAIKQEVRQYNGRLKKVTAVFDLDSTLLEVSPRMTQIFRDFGATDKIASRFFKESKILENYVHHPDDWDIEHALERVGLMDSSYEFFHELKKFWHKHFFSNTYLHFDIPSEGAVEFVQELVKCGVDVAYLTARETKSMWKGTVESLKNLDFPLDAKHANLILKPNTVRPDAVFKREVLEDYLKEYGSVWFFENEPVNLNEVLRELPQVKLVHFDSVHSGHEEPPQEVACIATFKFQR
ncbi:MAG: HAD family hydrolase [Pseudomonadota bacterium]|nr:HAD family hydrolase [Pseudomonadota bacterium]